MLNQTDAGALCSLESRSGKCRHHIAVIETDVFRRFKRSVWTNCSKTKVASDPWSSKARTKFFNLL